jgi:hypothetical protein
MLQCFVQIGRTLDRATIRDIAMAASKRVSLTFRHPFWLKGIDRRFAAGQYELITNEEPIEELRFPIYRRVATLIFLPADAGQASSIKMVDVDTADFGAAHERDQRASPPRSPPSGNLKPFEQS